MGDATLLDPAMEQQLGAALKSAAQFGRQTMQRVDAMKRTVLQAFEREERVDAPAPKAHGQYHKDINAKIVALVQGRAEAVEQFMSNQESAELTLSSLRRRLATMRGELESLESSKSGTRHAKLEATRQDSHSIVNHIVSVDQTRQEQIDAENTLRTLLDLKKKVLTQDRHALLISQETIMMSPESKPMSPLAHESGPHNLTTKSPPSSKSQTSVLIAQMASSPHEKNSGSSHGAAMPTPAVLQAVITQDSISPQGQGFHKGQQVTFIKVGQNGWTLIRDEDGRQCWLPSDHLDVDGGGVGEHSTAQGEEDPTTRESLPQDAARQDKFPDAGQVSAMAHNIGQITPSNAALPAADSGWMHASLGGMKEQHFPQFAVPATLPSHTTAKEMIALLDERLAALRLPHQMMTPDDREQAYLPHPGIPGWELEAISEIGMTQFDV